MSLRYLLSALAICYPSLCAANPTTHVQPIERDLSSLNGPSSRAQWTDSHDIDTDFDQVFPTTGRTVAYTLEITNTTCNPDGSGSRICSLVNGQFPGPTIRANWGDTVAITVKNSLQDNGTSIHFHGVRQYNSAGSDGVNGVTQCAIAPGDSATYRFHATQHGTGWYHSHTDMQYGDGVSGPIIIEGPASADYDVDLGGYMFSEVFGTTTAWQAGVNSKRAIQGRKGPPKGTSLLINGTSTNSNGGGTYNKVNIKRGKRYRLRLINSSVNTYVRVSLDNHHLTVIASDFVPIKPYTTDFLLMAIGQRYDVIIEANETSGAYWFRANVPALCLSGTVRNGSAIWDYGDSSQTSLPTSSAWPNESNDCVEPVLSPMWKEKVPPASFSNTLDVNLTKAVAMPNGNSIVVWVMNEPIWTNYSDPVIGYVMRGDRHLPKLFNTVDASKEGGWNYWLIINDQSIELPIPHPIHLHGHDFFVIGSDIGSYNEATAKLDWNNPTRRDTATLPGDGWLALAWRSNNPGTWLMHCHIAFHISEGFGIDYLEAVDQMTLPDEAQYQETCRNWQKYEKNEPYMLDSSGL